MATYLFFCKSCGYPCYASDHRGRCLKCIEWQIMEVSCPECGVLFIPHDGENPVVCPVCEWEWNIYETEVDEDWDSFWDDDEVIESTCDCENPEVCEACQ